jgi:orotate phosphoribosyltransferase
MWRMTVIDKVKGALQDFLTKSGVVEWITGLIHKLSDPENVKGLINMIKDGVAMVADMIEGIAYGVLNVANAITFGSNDKLQSMIEKMDESENIGDKIRSLGGDTSGNVKAVKDFVIKPLNEDTITMAGGTKLGRTDEMVDLLKQLLNETRQGKVMSVNIDGAPVATAVARNAPMNYAASNLGPRPLR